MKIYYIHFWHRGTLQCPSYIFLISTNFLALNKLCPPAGPATSACMPISLKREMDTLDRCVYHMFCRDIKLKLFLNLPKNLDTRCAKVVILTSGGRKAICCQKTAWKIAKNHILHGWIFTSFQLELQHVKKKKRDQTSFWACSLLKTMLQLKQAVVPVDNISSWWWSHCDQIISFGVNKVFLIVVSIVYVSHFQSLAGQLPVEVSSVCVHAHFLTPMSVPVSLHHLLMRLH